MFSRLSIQVPEENLEGQLDRLNFAVQHLMQGIELSSRTPRNPSSLSIFSHRDWPEEDKEEATEYGVPEEFEAKLEEILLQLDRSQMTVEDFWSEAAYKDNNNPKENENENEAYILKLEKECFDKYPHWHF